jgi:hypothetical protein
VFYTVHCESPIRKKSKKYTMTKSETYIY